MRKDQDVNESLTLYACSTHYLFLEFLFLARPFFSIFVLSLIHGMRPHACQLGRDAMVSPLPVAPPHGFVDASSATQVVESTRWQGHPGPMEPVRVSEQSQEVGRTSNSPKARSDAGWQMNLPPLRRHWKLNVVCCLFWWHACATTLVDAGTPRRQWRRWRRLGVSHSTCMGPRERVALQFSCMGPRPTCVVDAYGCATSTAGRVVMRLGGAVRELVRSIAQDTSTGWNCERGATGSDRLHCYRSPATICDVG